MRRCSDAEMISALVIPPVNSAAMSADQPAFLFYPPEFMLSFNSASFSWSIFHQRYCSMAHKPI